MLRGIVVLLAAAAVAVAATTGFASASAGSVRSEQALAAAVLVQVNDLRRAHHLVPLRRSAQLDTAAAAHSREMAVDGIFQHDSADGSAFWKRVERYYPSKRFGYWSVGENLLWASPDVDAPGALKLWLASPEHRRNLLTPRWREIGLSAVRETAAPGVFKGLDVTIVTTDFGVRR